MLDKRYFISTKRLKIIPLSLFNLRLYISDYQSFCKENGLSFQEKVLKEPLKRALSIKIQNIEKNPSNWHYYTYWLMIDKRNKQEVGTIGFKGLPDQKGIVEIGYGTEKIFQNQGFMSEALEAFIKDFPDELSRINKIRAQVAATNLPSIRILEKSGFEMISSIEYYHIYELTVIGGVI